MTAEAITYHRAATSRRLMADPERLILSPQEYAAIRDGHVPMAEFVPAFATGGGGRLWHVTCTCGISVLPARELTDCLDAHAEHVGEMQQREKVRKVGQRRAAIERQRIEAAIDSALETGLRHAHAAAEADGNLARIWRQGRA